MMMMMITIIIIIIIVIIIIIIIIKLFYSLIGKGNGEPECWHFHAPH